MMHIRKEAARACCNRQRMIEPGFDVYHKYFCQKIKRKQIKVKSANTLCGLLHLHEVTVKFLRHESSTSQSEKHEIFQREVQLTAAQTSVLGLFIKILQNNIG